MANAQTANQMTFKGGKYYLQGNRLSNQELQNTIGENAFQQYQKNMKLRKAGIITTSVGGGFVLAAGVSLLVAEETDEFGTTLGMGAIFPYLAGIGAATSVTGIILLCTGNKRLRNIAHTYNLNNGRQISIAPASSGIGIAVKF